MRVGVLALQGDVVEHVQALHRCGVEAVEVKDRETLEACSGLIVPGGESTTIGMLLERFGLLEPLRDMGRRGVPIYGTCAGLILLAKDIHDGIPGQPALQLLDVGAARNAFGRQRESFLCPIAMPALGDPPFVGVFIRAPQIVRIGPAVEKLGWIEGTVVAVRQGSLLATSFHPELTSDTRVHQYFVGMVREASRVGVPLPTPDSRLPSPVGR